MSVKFVFLNKKKVKKTLEVELEAKLEEAKEAIARGANRIRNTAIESVRNPSGQYKLYTRGSKGAAEHYSSPPGTPPNADTGFLQNNIVLDFEMEGEVAAVESRAEYSKFLEFGTRHMEPRPFMSPAFQVHIEDIRKDIRKALGKKKKKGGKK